MKCFFQALILFGTPSPSAQGAADGTLTTGSQIVSGLLVLQLAGDHYREDAGPKLSDRRGV